MWYMKIWHWVTHRCRDEGDAVTLNCQAEKEVTELQEKYGFTPSYTWIKVPRLPSATYWIGLTFVFYSRSIRFFISLSILYLHWVNLCALLSIYSIFHLFKNLILGLRLTIEIFQPRNKQLSKSLTGGLSGWVQGCGQRSDFGTVSRYRRDFLWGCRAFLL